MKKISFIACLLFLQSSYIQSNIKLTSPLLRIADDAGFFNPHIADILLTRLDIIALIQGEKEWDGVVVNLNIHNNDHVSLTTYLRRPEIIHGATFVTITPDHNALQALIKPEQQTNVHNYLSAIGHKSLHERLMHANLQGAFTGSYAINPINDELLPIYVSDYALECFDARKNHTRIGIPAHNSKDFDFAHFHKLALKVVVTVPEKNPGESGSKTTAPVLDKNNILKEAYLGEYRECIMTQSGNLNNLHLKDAAEMIIAELENLNAGYPYKEMLKYHYNQEAYSLKDLAKIETALHKSMQAHTAHHYEFDNSSLKLSLIYAQADFLEIVEKFLVNVKNTKSLMTALIEESCALRKIPHCYLLRWCHFSHDQSEKEIFRRDIINCKELYIFCRDLINFLSDLAHSCPNALKNISQ